MKIAREDADMPFTDDDLKRLKEAIGRVNVTSFGITMTPDEWNALPRPSGSGGKSIR